MESNTEEYNSVSAIKILGLIRELVLLVFLVFLQHCTAAYTYSSLVCQRKDNSCLGAIIHHAGD